MLSEKLLKVGAWGVGKISIIIIGLLSSLVFIFLTLHYFQVIDNKNIFAKRILLQSINEIIELDTKARIFYMKQKVLDKKEIENKLFSLEEGYEKERKKIFKYCLDRKSKYCYFHSDITGFFFPYVSLVLDYKFDKESLTRFNQKYILNTHEKYLGVISGIDFLKYNNMEEPFLKYKDNYIDGGVDFKRVQKLNEDELLN